MTATRAAEISQSKRCKPGLNSACQFSSSLQHLGREIRETRTASSSHHTRKCGTGLTLHCLTLGQFLYICLKIFREKLILVKLYLFLLMPAIRDAHVRC
ncbi:hypothetical protein GDO81_002521 [Engystomops pustulosus]|uniref:Uncharacterized protein n=1 Tax=Engystomops pustulosus TaxID=76066 RepID=A0AAV7DME8_ENGPU|nr:hypothetical protein GDO81_002521 [Engystomops pustulosus]